MLSDLIKSGGYGRYKTLLHKVRNLFFQHFEGESRNRRKVKVKSKISLPNFLSLYIFIYIYIYIYICIYLFLFHSISPLSLSLSLSISLCLSLSHGSKKITVPQSLLQIGGDRGPIETVNLAVCEGVAENIGADVGHTHLFDANWDLVFVFKPTYRRLPWRVK